MITHDSLFETLKQYLDKPFDRDDIQWLVQTRLNRKMSKNSASARLSKWWKEGRVALYGHEALLPGTFGRPKNIYRLAEMQV